MIHPSRSLVSRTLNMSSPRDFVDQSVSCVSSRCCSVHVIRSDRSSTGLIVKHAFSFQDTLKMAAITIPQASIPRSISTFISTHLPALPTITARLSVSSSASSSSVHATEDSVKATYETPSRTFGSLLAELFPPFLLAAPKSKTSHSRKSMRSATKGLKNKTSECRVRFPATFAT